MVHETFIGGGLSSVSWPMWFPFGSADFVFFQGGIKRRTNIIKEAQLMGLVNRHTLWFDDGADCCFYGVFDLIATYSSI